MVLKPVDGEKRRQIIIGLLKGTPNINEEIWKKFEKHGILGKATYYNTRNGLIRDKIICKKEIGRQVWLYLPEDETLFQKTAKIDKKDVDDKEKIRLRIAHTKDIKEKVIRPWLEQMKQKKESIVSPRNYYFSGESEPLFLDFKKHLKFKPDPFFELAHLEKINKTFERKKETLRCMVDSIISQVLEESPALFFIERDEIKEVTYTGDDYDEARWSLYKWITDLMYERRYYFYNTEIYDEIYMNFMSTIVVKESICEYYVNDIYCGYIRKSDLPKEEFQTKMDECIKTILKKIRESEPIKNEIESLDKLDTLMEKHLNNMLESLEKHLCLGVLPGDCEYYYWVESK